MPSSTPPFTLDSLAAQDGGIVMVQIKRVADGALAAFTLGDDDFGGPVADAAVTSTPGSLG